MGDYTLRVFHEGRAIATDTQSVSHAADVIEAIQTLLAKHPKCFRIHVYAGPVKLFSVDCNGVDIRD